MPSDLIQLDAADVLDAEASQLFEKLKHDTSYRNGFREEKLRVIKRLLEMKTDMERFAADPCRLPHEINGFLVECCARFSTRLPKNTPEADEFAETVLSYLKQQNLCNPDYLWLEICGERITVNGIGEVKSHLQSIRHHPYQISFQERTFYNLIGLDQIGSILSVNHQVVPAEHIVRYLILPRSVGMPYLLPPSVPLGWEIKEIEFTFPEILFLKKLLLPVPQEDTPHKTFACSLAQYKLCCEEIIMRTKQVMLDFFGHLPFMRDVQNQYALMSWSLLTNSVPTNQASIAHVIEWIDNIRKSHKDILGLLSIPPESLSQPDEKETLSLHAIVTRVTESDTRVAGAFLSRIKQLTAKLPTPPELEKKIDIDLFSIL